MFTAISGSLKISVLSNIILSVDALNNKSVILSQNLFSSGFSLTYYSPLFSSSCYPFLPLCFLLFLEDFKGSPSTMF